MSSWKGRRPVTLTAYGADSHPVSMAKAEAILNGEYRKYGQSLVCPADEVWTTPLPSLRFAHWLHSFDWMADLAAHANSDAAQAHLLELVQGWLAQYGRYNRFVWQPDLVSKRLSAWLMDDAGLLQLDQPESVALRKSIHRQASYLRKTLHALPSGLPLLHARITMAVYAARQGRTGSAQLSNALSQVDALLSEQVLPDGAHVCRSPQATLALLDRLKSLDNLLDRQGLASRPGVARAIDRLSPMIAFFSHTDGGLAGFHGGGEGDHARVSRAISTLTSRPFAFAPHARYQRLERDGTVILVDMGGPAPFPHDGEAHIGPLAFEMSVPEGRLITNCAWSTDQPEAWRTSSRCTSAHSTMDILGHDAGRFREQGTIARPYAGQAISRDCQPVTVERREAEPGIIVEGSHHGFVPATGHIHSRRLFLAETGHDMRGEDSLRPAQDDMDVYSSQETFCLRFHLHPDVEPRLAQDGRHVRLSFPDGRQWVFLSGGGDEAYRLELRESAYLAVGARPRPTHQIIIEGPLSPNDTVTISWALKRADMLTRKAPLDA